VDRTDEMPPFPAVLAQLRRGAAVDEFTAELAELVQAVIYTGRKGTLTLKLEVEPSSSDDQAVEITDEVTTRLPKPPRPSSLFFADDRGALSRHDRRQTHLDL